MRDARHNRSLEEQHMWVHQLWGEMERERESERDEQIRDGIDNGVVLVAETRDALS